MGRWTQALSLVFVAQLALAPVALSAQQATGRATAATSTDESSYVLGVDDKVMVSVFGEDALSKEYVVGPSGAISMPLIGDIQAAGKSLGQVQTEVRQKLAEGYLKDPSVSMQITSFRPFYILGEVNKPGEYPYRDGLTVTAAVATAEGFTYRAKKSFVFIKHRGETEEKRVGMSPSLVVQPGDTIRFGERYF